MLSLFIILEVLVLIFILVYMVFLVYVAFLSRDVVPYLPTPRRAVRKMMAVAALKSEDKVADLGSGNGRLLLEAAKICRDVVGVEKSRYLYLLTRLRARLARAKIRMVQGNMYEFDVSDRDVILSFLTTKALERLKPQFALLKPGSRIITYMFNFQDDNFVTSEFEVPRIKKYKVYLKVRK
ncbi:class I SAM-dependent methyltransferase [Candidatus Uhrbacteria bacterium]|nr:class I SAM-dependent methyltransferase [Candidatus Uhrbacteria bacterium]